jgi:hypothetical protein
LLPSVEENLAFVSPVAKFCRFVHFIYFTSLRVFLVGLSSSELYSCRFVINFVCSGSVNVTSGVKEDRLMMTGMHTVSDIFCVGCGSIVGWKYVRLCDDYFATISCALPVL